MADKSKREFRFMATHFNNVTKLIRANEAETVVIPQEILDQGSEAQSPAEDAPTEPGPPAPDAGKGKSDNNPGSQRRDRQAPSA